MPTEHKDTWPTAGSEVVHTRADAEVLTKSWDQNIGIWLRNMSGTHYDLGAVIRILADKASLTRRKLEILDVIDGIPLKGLELRGQGFRNRGDFLIHGARGSHPKTEVTTTVVSEHDWTSRLLRGELNIPERDLKDVQDYFLHAALDYPNISRTARPDEVNTLLLPIYESMLKAGDFNFERSQNLIFTLNKLYRDGKRFDLVFLDPEFCNDKLACFIAVQKILIGIGVAYIPINWWSPKSLEERGGVDESVLWHEVIKTDEGEENLEDYLARRYPDAFEIAYFPGAKTLIIKGTRGPMNFDDIKKPLLDTENKEHARGNQVIKTITEDRARKTLIISWANSMIRDTVIRSEGREKPIYNFIKKRYGDITEATSDALNVWTDEDGSLQFMGEINGEQIFVDEDK